MSSYEDIIDLPYPRKRQRMSNSDRSAQFSPFAALTGFGAAIMETARLTDRKIELDEGGKALLDEKLRKIEDEICDQPEVTVTYFRQDLRKAGGAYLQKRGRVGSSVIETLRTQGALQGLSETNQISMF